MKYAMTDDFLLLNALTPTPPAALPEPASVVDAVSSESMLGFVTARNG